MFARFVAAFVLMLCVNAVSASDFVLLPPEHKPARLAVVVYDPQGLAVTPPAYAGTGLYYNPAMAGGGLAAQAAGQALSVALETKRRGWALGPEWKALDHDALDDRLQAIVHQHINRAHLDKKAKIKDMKFFGLSKAGYLQRFTPGTVLVYEARMGFSPELEEIFFQVEESIWDFRFRAKSKRELKRIPDSQVQDHQPTITRLNTHDYRFRPVLDEAKLTEKMRKKPYFKKIGKVWQADGSKLLLEQIELGFDAIEASMAAAAVPALPE